MLFGGILPVSSKFLLKVFGEIAPWGGKPSSNTAHTAGQTDAERFSIHRAVQFVVYSAAKGTNSISGGWS